MSLLLLFNQARNPRHFDLLRLARQLLDEHKPDLAVVTAQTACEVYAEVAITEMLKARQLEEFEEVIPALLNSFSLKDKRGQLVFHALTGKRIQQADFWADYHAHVQRRHAVIHRGVEVAPELATASVAAATSFFEYVATAWEQTVASASQGKMEDPASTAGS